MESFSPTPQGFIHFFVDHYNATTADSYVPPILLTNTYVIWFSSYMPRGAKCIISTILNTGMYYELTYDADTNRVYIDEYSKVRHTITSATK